MTDASVPVPAEEAVDRWLAAQQEILTAGLADRLDVEAGLHEALIYARHDGLVHDIGHALDLDAGLAAILPPPMAALALEPLLVPKGQEARRQKPSRDIASLDPGKRLVHRKHPVVIASIRGGLFLRAVGLARDFAHAGALPQTRVDARDLATDINLACDDTRDLAFGLVRDLARDLTGNLVSNLPRARALARDLARNFANSLERSLADTIDIDTDIDLARDLARSIARDFAIELTRGHDPAFDYGLALDRARASVNALDRAVGRLLGLQDVEGLGTALLNTPLDDFTGADLRNVDLTDVDLLGVRWSDRTRWPSALDIGWLMSNSQEIKPGSGVYVVRPGTATAAAEFTRV